MLYLNIKNILFCIKRYNTTQQQLQPKTIQQKQTVQRNKQTKQQYVKQTHTQTQLQHMRYIKSKSKSQHFNFLFFSSITKVKTLSAFILQI